MLSKVLPYFFSSACFIVFFRNAVSAQTSYSTKNFVIEKAAAVSPGKMKEDWKPQLQNLEMPRPGSERERLRRIKEESRRRFPLREKQEAKPGVQETVLSPIIIKGFEANKYTNSVPNDNNMAVSNGGKLISVSNTVVHGYDIEQDTLLFAISLSLFAQQLGLTGSKYDPKALYDPESDRFIIVFLNGTAPANSKVIIAFSETNNPAGTWNLYYLSGDPLNDSTWSDYPAIAITKDELFLTVNQIIPGQPWQTGFSQTLIWQIDKKAGFEGRSKVNARLWKDIWFGANPVRNLCPVGGGSRLYGPNMFLLSNRNFAIQNDTIFMVEITGRLTDPSSILKIRSGVTDIPYGVPPTARQANGHTFDTNDGRVLGGFRENNKIQFVCNTIDTVTGYAAIYHGIISDPEEIFSVKGKIIGDTSLDLGYPNISYAGKQECDNEAVITFNHTSPSFFSGFSAVWFTNNNKYSGIVKIKEGENFVNILSGAYERWGDYSGSQRRFNAPGEVWAVGSYGNAQNENATWVAGLQSPDSNIMKVTVSRSRDVSMYLYNDGYAEIEAAGGNEPYSYVWSNGTSGAFSQGMSAGKYIVTVTDAYSCTVSDTVEIAQPEPVSSLFPNPSGDLTAINFQLENDAVISIAIYDAQGKLIRVLWEDQAKAGRNIFTFSAEPLAKGLYFLKITSGDREIFREKFIKG